MRFATRLTGVIAAWTVLSGTVTLCAQYGASEGDRRFGNVMPQATGQSTVPAKTPIKLARPKQPVPLTDRNQNANARGSGSWWVTVGSLGLIVALILVTAGVWKKHAPALQGGLPSEALEILGKRHIDHRQTVYLVRLGSRILALGSSQGALRTLAEFDAPAEVDFLAGACRQSENTSGAAAAFRSLFGKQMARTSQPTPNNDTQGRSSAEEEFTRRLQFIHNSSVDDGLEKIHG